MINFQPTHCNLCDGNVVYISNSHIYKVEYGSGYCYLCTKCGAYVGTHRYRKHIAMGILANPRMRKAKTICHELFDKHWRGRNQRRKMYQWLSKELGIAESDCHFGYFDIYMLIKAYRVLDRYKNKRAIWSNKNNIKEWRVLGD